MTTKFGTLLRNPHEETENDYEKHQDSRNLD
jgi:hypothetical protein